MARLTMKLITKMVNEAFDRLGIKNVEAFETYNPRFRSHELENGAAHLITRVRSKDDASNFFVMYFFDSRLDLEYEINKGAVFTIELRERYILQEAWIRTTFLV